MGLHYLCRENKGADQLHDVRRFSHEDDHICSLLTLAVDLFKSFPAGGVC